MMFSHRKLALRASNVLRRHYKMAAEMEPRLHDDLASNEVKARRHPGVMRAKLVTFPPHVLDAIVTAMQDTPLKTIVDECGELTNYLHSRLVPPEQWQLDEKLKKIKAAVEEEIPIDKSKMSEPEIDIINKRRRKVVRKRVKERVYTWEAITFDRHTSLKYLVGRSPPEYAVLYRIFSEIKQRDPDFAPDTFFDFGSGVGTGTWALNECWNKTLSEYFTVDVSADVNDVAREIITSAYSIPEQRYFQRQFLPSKGFKYDLVLSAYTLLELSSAKSRLQNVFSLWRKTKNYLVLVERGTNAGYSLLCEARDFILSLKEETLIGHVFAPCPHDAPCPRFREDNTPCNFQINYMEPKFTDKSEMRTERFSYVVLKKGERSRDPEWPRIVRPTLLRSKHVICRMCCGDGKLKETIFTKWQHGAVVYKCAKMSNWGDLLPMTLKDLPKDFVDQSQKDGDDDEVDTESKNVEDNTHCK